jgi:hypothetical protein
MISDILIPAGYIPVRQATIISQLHLWILQGVAFPQFPDKKALFGAQYKIASELVAGRFDTAGLDPNTGSLVIVPKTAWRLGYQRGDGKICTTQVEAALYEDEAIITEHATGRWVYPLMKLRDLAQWLGASIEPEPPEQLPLTEDEASTGGGLCPDCQRAWRWRTQTNPRLGCLLDRGSSLDCRERRDERYYDRGPR